MEQKRTSLGDYGHWITIPFDQNAHFGFVYEITNLLNGKSYIGCKQLKNKVTRKPLKGKKNKRHSTKDSNWKEYTGSSKQLNEDIEEYGEDCFVFEILSLHNTLWEMKYAELKQIVTRDAIPSEKFYNEYIGRIGKCPKQLKIQHPKT